MGNGDVAMRMWLMAPDDQDDDDSFNSLRHGVCECVVAFVWREVN